MERLLKFNKWEYHQLYIDTSDNALKIEPQASSYPTESKLKLTKTRDYKKINAVRSVNVVLLFKLTT